MSIALRGSFDATFRASNVSLLIVRVCVRLKSQSGPQSRLQIASAIAGKDEEASSRAGRRITARRTRPPCDFARPRAKGRELRVADVRDIVRSFRIRMLAPPPGASSLPLVLSRSVTAEVVAGSCSLIFRRSSSLPRALNSLPSSKRDSRGKEKRLFPLGV